MSIRHCGIVVRDLDKMIRFYKLLGFEEIINDEISGELIDNLIGVKNTNIKFAKLKSLKNNSIIELLKYQNVSLSTGKRELYEKGFSHLAINVDDMDNVFEVLRENGAEFISAPLLTDDGVRVCFCRDIENNFIELVENMKRNLTKDKNNYIDVVYSEAVRPKTEYPQQLVNYLVDRFDIKDGNKVLDTGCGRGEFLESFRNAGMDAVGVDLFNNGNPEIFEADFERDRLPFEDNSFDAVFSKSILEHLSNPQNYIQEIYRILKPGGRIIVLVPEYDSCQYLYWDDYTHKQPYRINSVRDLLMIHKFRDVSARSFIQLPMVWKYPVLEYVCRFLQWFGAPKRIIKNKFLRFSRELMILSVGIKGN